MMQYVFGYAVVPMNEIAEIKRGVRVVKNDLDTAGQYPVYQNCLTPLGYSDTNNRTGGMPFVIVGGAAGNVGYSFSDFWAADDCLTVDSDSTLTNRYIYHFLLTQQQFLLSRVRKSSVPRLPRTTIDNMAIPIPTIAEQERIVAILDKFDALVNDISIGLPAEIEARRKQYEYYRNKLLTFKRKTA